MLAEVGRAQRPLGADRGPERAVRGPRRAVAASRATTRPATSTSCSRSPTCSPTRSSGRRPRTGSATARCTTRSPASPTGSCSSTGSSRRSRGCAGAIAGAILFLDLDRFKLVNDSLGHQVGDELLAAAAPRLKQAVRASDTVARFGGDEFGILLEDIAGEHEASEMAERIASVFTRPFVLAGSEHFVTTSIGIALARGGELAEELIRDADAAMYRAKEHGRARYELFDEVMRERAMVRLRVENDLRRALERTELRPRLPAGRLAARPLDRERRGAGALAAPRARADPTRRVHPDRRGERADRADRPLGPRAGLPPGGPLASRSPRRRAGYPSTFASVAPSSDPHSAITTRSGSRSCSSARSFARIAGARPPAAFSSSTRNGNPSCTAARCTPAFQPHNAKTAMTRPHATGITARRNSVNSHGTAPNHGSASSQRGPNTMSTVHQARSPNPQSAIQANSSHASEHQASQRIGRCNAGIPPRPAGLVLVGSRQRHQPRRAAGSRPRAR